MSLRLKVPRWLRKGGRHIGKVRYGSLATAKRACDEMAAKGREGLTPYFCVICTGYHIGHEPGLSIIFDKIEKER
jgi:hypothetical protein